MVGLNLSLTSSRARDEEGISPLPLVGAAPAFALGSGHVQPEARPFPFSTRLGGAGGPGTSTASARAPPVRTLRVPANVSPILGMRDVRPAQRPARSARRP